MRLGLLYHFIKGIYGFRIVPGWEEKSLFKLLSAQNSNFDSLGLTLPLPYGDGIAPNLLELKGKIRLSLYRGILHLSLLH